MHYTTMRFYYIEVYFDPLKKLTLSQQNKDNSSSHYFTRVVSMITSSLAKVSLFTDSSLLMLKALSSVLYYISIRMFLSKHTYSR